MRKNWGKQHYTYFWCSSRVLYTAHRNLKGLLLMLLDVAEYFCKPGYYPGPVTTKISTKSNRSPPKEINLDAGTATICIWHQWHICQQIGKNYLRKELFDMFMTLLWLWSIFALLDCLQTTTKRLLCQYHQTPGKIASPLRLTLSACSIRGAGCVFFAFCDRIQGCRKWAWLSTRM